MQDNFEVVIGIEIHLELKTKTKMFSPAKIDFDAEPNTCVNQIDLAYPGTLPLVNKEAVVSAVKLAKALNMEVDDELHFDRKNYFYTDLPKGYQITQFYRPIGKNGYVIIDTEKGKKKIQIERIHLEEDTARQHHNVYTELDYNRAGVPLIEIVTEPVISSKEEAVEYVDMIRKIALSLDISDAKMEQGSLRADVNVSIKPKGYNGFGTKVEIKNMNSFRAISQAIKYEIEWQKDQVFKHEEILEQTKRYDDSTQSTVLMRYKTEDVDYKYFPDANIPFIKLSSEFLNNVKMPELPWEKEERYLKENIQPIYIKSLVNDLELAKYFDSIEYKDRDQLSKLFFAEIVSLANSKNVHSTELNIKNEYLIEAINEMDNEVISGRSFKTLVPLLVDFEGDLQQLIEEKNLKQISDVATLTNWINEIINNNPEQLTKYLERPDNVIKFVIGQVMKLSKGRANPNKTNEIVKEVLDKKAM